MYAMWCSLFVTARRRICRDQALANVGQALVLSFELQIAGNNDHEGELVENFK